MPIEPSDIILLPYDPQFSRAGVGYACHSLHYTYNRMHLPTPERLRKIVSGIAFELAVRRWLEEIGVPYERLGATAFTDPDRYDLAIGGRRCDLKSFLIYNKSKIRALHHDPSWALGCEALVSLDQFESERMGEGDIYIFGLVTGLEARHTADTQKALEKQLPVCLIHTLPPQWGDNREWRSLGPLSLKSDTSQAMAVEIGGQPADRSAVREPLTLLPRQAVSATYDFYAALYLSVPSLPDGRLGIHSPALKSTHIINPSEWSNIWLYGQRIYVCGWMNKHDFRLRSRHLPAHSKVRQYARTATANRALPMNKLRPMKQLVEIAKRHSADSSPSSSAL